MTSALHDFNISPSTRIGYASLNVSDIDRSLDFYEKVLGFKKITDLPMKGHFFPSMVIHHIL